MQKPALFVVALAFAVPAMAQHGHGTAPPVASSSKAALTEGEIRKVDKDTKKVTIKHGPIVNLDMPAMTMAFDVKDAKLLEKAKSGDKVRFRVEREGSAYVVTQLEPAR